MCSTAAAAQDCFGLWLPFRRRFAAVLLAELRDAAVLRSSYKSDA